MDVMVLETQKWLNDTYAGQTGFVPFTQEELDGVTGAGTFRRLVQALQIELNVSVDGSFGNDTLNAMPASISTSSQESNMSYIIQGFLWCKGYSAGTLDGIFGESTKNAVISFQENAGITADGIIKPYILQGIMNTDGYKYSWSTGTNDYYNVSRNCEHRFSIFKRELLEQFEKDTLYDVALEFAKEDVFMLSPAFEVIFGVFSSDIYGEVLAQAFDDKISSLATSM